RQEIDRVRALIYTDETGFLAIAHHHPWPGGQRTNELAVGIIQIKMFVARASRRPDECLRVLEKVKVMVQLEPMRARFLEQHAGAAVARIDVEEIEPLLIPRLALNRKRFGAREPIDAREIPIA